MEDSIQFLREPGLSSPSRLVTIAPFIFPADEMEGSLTLPSSVHFLNQS